MQPSKPTGKKPNTPDEQHSEHSDSGPDGSRQASIARKQSGDPIGAAIWISTAELAALGIDPDRTDAVTIEVTDGDLELTPTHAEGSDQ
jgi:hypothetical protein